MLSGDMETNGSIIIILFPSSMSISNQSIVNQNYIENEDLVVRFITPCEKDLQ